MKKITKIDKFHIDALAIHTLYVVQHNCEQYEDEL